MKNTELEIPECSPTAHTQPCAGRREFLTRCVAGGVAIALSGATSSAHDAENHATPAKAESKKSRLDAGEILIQPSDFPALAKVGGFVTLNTTAGKIVVARVKENKFVAVGAVCTHKKGPIEYSKEKGDFYCPWHNSRFNLNGAVVKGPAKIALPHYKEETATVIKLS